MATNREIHGEVILDAKVEGEERARKHMQEAFANLEATVEVNADFDRAQVQIALGKVAGKGVKVGVNASFTLTQMRAAARVAAARGKGISVNVNASFNAAQIQRELLIKSVGAKIPVVAEVIGVDDRKSAPARKAISEKLASEFRLAQQAAASDPAAAREAVKGVNQRLNSFANASQSMRQIERKAELAREKFERDQRALSEKDERDALRRTEQRLDKEVDERAKAARKITSEHNTANEKIRVDDKRTANNKTRLEDQVNAGIDKGRTAIRVHAEKEQENRVTRELNNESNATHQKDVLRERSNLARIVDNHRTLSKLEVREDSHVKRLVEFEQSAAFRREVIATQLQARLDAQNNAFEQRRQIAAERAERALRTRAEKPIVQQVLLGADKINASLTEFDRTVTRVLRTTLTSFVVWSAAVEAAVVGAVAAGAVAFGRLEIAGTRAGAVVASQIRADEIIKGGQAISNFATVTEDARIKIQANAQAIALATTGFSPTEVVEGTRALLQAGQSLPEALINIGSAARFAQVNELELAEASDRLAAGLAASGKSAEFSNKLLDQISFTAQSALGNAGDFLEAFANRGASSFRTYGEGIEETLTLLALLGQTGVTGKAAGTQASIVIRDIAKAAQKSGPAFEAYGVAVKSATNPNVTFNETLLSLAAAIEAAQKGNRIAKLRKDLGFMDRSFGSILQIIPQVNALGSTGLDNFAKGLKTSAGSVNRQVNEINKTLPAQFDKVSDAINIALGKMGARYGESLTQIFDEFAGPGGLITRATPALLDFGDQVAIVFGNILDFIKTDNFIAGIKTLEQAIATTLGGVSDAFRSFAAAFNDGEEAGSTFEALADSILAFSQLSAAVLPAVARILGTIFDFFIDNADAFETFAKLTLGLFAVRKAYALLIKPVGAATLALLGARDAIALAAATGTGGAIANGLAIVATKFGFIAKEAEAATVAVNALTAAEGRLAAAEGGVALTGAAADASRAGRVQTGARGVSALDAGVGAAELGTTAALGRRAATQQKAAAGFTKALNAANPVAAKSIGIFARLEATILRLTPAFAKGLPVIGGLISGFARFAGPVGLAVSALFAVIAVTKGFVKGFQEAREESPELARSFAQIGKALGVLGDGLTFVTDIIDDFFIAIGERLGAAIAETIGALGDFLTIVDKVLHLEWSDAGDAAVSMFKNIAKAGTDAAGALAPIFGGNIVPGLGPALTNIAALRDQIDKTDPSARTLSETMRHLSDSVEQVRKKAFEATAGIYSLDPATGKFVRTADSAGRAVGRLDTIFNELIDNLPPGARAAASSLVTSFNRMRAGVGGAVEETGTAFDRLARRILRTSETARAALRQMLADKAVADATATLPPGGQLDINAQALIGAERLAFDERLNPGLRRGREIIRKQAAEARRKAALAAAGIGDPSLDEIPAGGAGGGSAPQPKQRTFVDPDDAIQSAIDRLKPVQKIAQTQALITKVTNDAGRGYQLTRRDTLLLAEALPTLDKAIEEQRGKVQKLDEALSNLRNTQLKGTKAFSDAAFANEQSIKRLQLARLDALAVAGTTEESAPVVAIDAQIKALQAQAERASLVESLELDPLKRKLEETFNPVKEDTFANIIAQFKNLSVEQSKQSAFLVSQEAQQKLLNDTLGVAQTRYTKLDEAAQKSVEAFNQAQQAAASTATSISAVGTSAAAGATTVNRFSTAVENVPSGKGVVDKSLKGINERVTALIPQFQGAGDKVMVAFTQGINRTYLNVTRPAYVRIVGEVEPYLAAGAPGAQRAGVTVMSGFLTGIVEKFDAKGKTPGSIAHYLNVFIPKWIKENKGPVAADAQILVPAGHAVMEGFGKGLRAGFSEIQGFVKDVGPSLQEFISDDAFSAKIAPIFADIAIGKTPDVDGVLGALRGAVLDVSGGAAVNDPRLGFLHRTLSIKDTQTMAESLAKTFGTTGGVTTDRATGATTTAGNLSAHPFGRAADMGTGGSQPTSASLAMFAAIKPLLGNIFKEIIHNGIGLEAGGGSFPDDKHFNHVHAEWLVGKGFDKYSGKIGKPAVIDIPGASDVVDQALNQAAQKYNIPLAVLAGLIKQESGFNVGSRNSQGDGGSGLGQLTSPGLQAKAEARGGLFNPFANADVSAEYLAGFLKNNSVRDAVGLYNAGSKPFPSSTINSHIPKVMAYIKEFERIFGGFREQGGDVRAGKAYVVGEKRPEIFVPSSSGTILPDAAATLSDTGKTYQDNRVIHNHVHTNATDPEAILAVMDSRTRTSMAGVNFR